ncbi:MAG: lysoplasmalogenase [Gemmatimonadales bacterium]
MLVPGLSVAAFACGALCIHGKYSDSHILVYVFKPLATALVLSVAVAAGAFATTYGRLVALSLVFSLAGDVFLMLPKDRFINGLLSFLVAHVVLSVAFALQATGLSWWLLLPVIAGTGMYMALAPHLGRMKIPVVVYITVIAAMAWFALERWHLQGSTSAALAASGSVLFLLSDSTLALNRFRAKFRLAELLVLSTYYASIWLTALSVHRDWI